MHYLSRMLRLLGVLLFGRRAAARHARGRHLAPPPQARCRRLYTCWQPPVEWNSMLRLARRHPPMAPRVARLYEAVGGTASAIRPYVLSPSERRVLLGWEAR